MSEPRVDHVCEPRCVDGGHYFESEVAMMAYLDARMSPRNEATSGQPGFTEEDLETRLFYAESALAELVRLKDGPRDADYVAAKWLAWSRARAVLAQIPKSESGSMEWADPVEWHRSAPGALVAAAKGEWLNHIIEIAGGTVPEVVPE